MDVEAVEIIFLYTHEIMPVDLPHDTLLCVALWHCNAMTL